MSEHNTIATAALQKAKKEIGEEKLNEAVAEFKMKLRERERAATVLANIDREIKELELKITQGN